MASASEKSRYSDEDIKSGSSKMREVDEEQYPQDYEVHTKKDAPPRFSTIFETKTPVPAPMIFEEPPRRRRTGGVFIPTPIFILLVIILALETIVIFAYTTIGLYNQLPGRLTMMSHSSTTAYDVLGTQPQQAQVQAQPAINFEPHIVVGAAEPLPAVTQTVTYTDLQHLPIHESTTTSTSSVSSTVLSSSMSSIMTSSSSTTSQSMVIVTFTPGGGTFTSVVFVTPTAAPQTTQERSTSFVTVVVPPPTGSDSSSVAPSSHTSSTTMSSTSTSSTSSSTTTTSSSLTTTTMPPTTTSTTSSSTTVEAKTAKACFPGIGPGGGTNCL